MYVINLLACFSDYYLKTYGLYHLVQIYKNSLKFLRILSIKCLFNYANWYISVDHSINSFIDIDSLLTCQSLL